MPYPRFTKVIIQHFISKNKSISMRNRLFMHSIKNDSVLGRLKFVAKNEDNQVYGMSVPDVMINKEIENSKACSFTADDNIFPDADVDLELEKSISKTKAKEHEEARKVHERLVTVKPTSDEDLMNLMLNPQEGQPEEEDKLELLSEILLIEGAGITSKFPEKPKDKSTDTNEGSSITPKIPDVSKDNSWVQDMDEEDCVSNEDDVIFSNDDEGTEF
nr:hypothetical protein [Tanacetum cinerariifolium]